jgi:hypothetical protein
VCHVIDQSIIFAIKAKPDNKSGAMSSNGFHACYPNKLNFTYDNPSLLDQLLFRNCFPSIDTYLCKCAGTPPGLPCKNLPKNYFDFCQQNPARSPKLIAVLAPLYSNSIFVIIMTIDLIYPFALIILAGIAATKTEFLPYATGVVVLLLALNSMRSSLQLIHEPTADGLEQLKLRKVLKPDVYQNFELAEKNVISHNTAS